MSLWDFSAMGERPWTAMGKRRVGEVLVSPGEISRLVLPLSIDQIATERDELLLMVHIVLKGSKSEAGQRSRSPSPRRALPTQSLPYKLAHVRLLTTEKSATDAMADDNHWSRFISVCGGSYFGQVTYRTENVWLPLRGRYLFVENTSKQNEARVSLTALAFRRKPDADDTPWPRSSLA